MNAQPFLLTGGCHCRALRYAVTQAPLGVYVCHCTDCQSLSGAAFAIGVVVPAAAFNLVGFAAAQSRMLLLLTRSGSSEGARLTIPRGLDRQATIGPGVRSRGWSSQKG